MTSLKFAVIFSMLLPSGLLYSMDAGQKSAEVHGLTVVGLFSAVELGDEDAVSKILSNYNLSVNEENPGTKMTPVMVAAQEGHLAIVKLLCSLNADINRVTFQGATALRYAIAKRHKEREEAYYEIAEFLLNKAANQGIQDASGNTVLWQTAMSGDERMTRLLLKYKPQLELKNKVGVTALMVASLKRHVGIVRMLLDAGADSNTQNDIGFNGFMYGVSGGSEAIVREYLARGVNPHLRTSVGQTTLMIAAASKSKEWPCNYPAIVHLLLTAGVDPHIRDLNGNTALDLAQKMNFEDVRIPLEGCGIPTDVKRVTIIEAARAGDLNAVAEDLKNGVFVDTRYQNSETALHAAVQGGHASLVKLLIEHGANVNREAIIKVVTTETATVKATPLALAHLKGSHECARLLLEAGAQLDTRSK